MTSDHKSAILALLQRRGIVTLEFICRKLSNLRIEDLSSELLSEIDAILLEAGWVHSSRASDGEIPIDIYERPMQDIPCVATDTTRVTATAILHEAARAIDNRAAARDMQAERSMARTVAAFNALTGRALSEVEGWLFMATLKAARATAGAHNGDDYTDGAAYFALAGECAAKAAP
jgi:hypothetical protein